MHDLFRWCMACYKHPVNSNDCSATKIINYSESIQINVAKASLNKNINKNKILRQLLKCELQEAELFVYFFSLLYLLN